MAKMLPLEIATYVSDIEDKEYKKLPIKIREGFQSDAGSIYQAKTKAICNVSNLFTPRRLIATFHTDSNNAKYGAKIIYPVPRTQDIATMVNALKANGAACIDLEGEEWQYVPPTIGNYTIGSGSFTLSVGSTSPKTAGTIKGDSDVQGANQNFKVRWETDPSALSSAISDCAGPFVTEEACFSSNLNVRKVIIYSVNQAGGKIVRSAPVAKKEDILDCIAAIMDVNGVHCVGYKGESAKRVDLLIGATAPTP